MLLFKKTPGKGCVVSNAVKTELNLRPIGHCQLKLIKNQQKLLSCIYFNIESSVLRKVYLCANVMLQFNAIDKK